MHQRTHYPVPAAATGSGGSEHHVQPGPPKRRLTTVNPDPEQGPDAWPLSAEPRTETVDLERPLRYKMLRAGLTEADVGWVREEVSGDHRRRAATELEEAGALAGEPRGGHPAGEPGGDPPGHDLALRLGEDAGLGQQL